MSLVKPVNSEAVQSAGPIGPAGISLADPKDFFSLLKPRVMVLVIFTALVGMVLAPSSQNLFISAVALLCIAVGAGASGALNMWYDADIDKVMTRTQRRPIPAGKVTAKDALSFGLVLSFLSVLTLGVLVNWMAGGLLAFTIFFYAVIYTMWLKRSTPQNIVIGGAAGAFPPMIGWAAMTGSFSWESVVLFAITFMWTPPHFWALSLWKMGDYDAADIPMMPNIAGVKSTRTQMLIYSILLAPVCVMPSFFGFASIYYGAVAAIASGWFVYLSVRVVIEQGANNFDAERALFKYSIWFLTGIFAALLVDGLVFTSL